MLNRFIPLKRNVILLQLPVILPMIILSGFIAYFIHSLGLKNWDKTFLSIMFVIYIIISVRIYLENKNFIQFSNNEIIECNKNKNGVKILKTYNVDAIKSIVCDNKKKRIKFLYHNCPEKYFLKFKYTNLTGEEIYFKIKSELCRYYPAKTVSIRDEYIEYYLKNNTVPEYIKSKDFSERCSAIVIIFLEFILAIIPIGLTVLSVLWAVFRIWIYLRIGTIVILNFFH